jgi:Uncharacterized conserved protein (some members contain a von Willebrand factor type A (vWA) domain)
MPMKWPDEREIAGIRSSARIVAGRMRLPFRSRTWRGTGGNWQGAGVGNSIDFQDHRQYLPGDDPRYIDWQAYARTGHYTMKLYREEVSPRVDLVLDATASMALNEAKRRRSLETFYFALESALRSGASVRCFVTRGGTCVPWAVESAVIGGAPPESEDRVDEVPGAALTPWRSGSLRVWISDLLFPGSPESVLATMSASKGRGILLVVQCRDESDPDWSGNIEFVDCETGGVRSQHVGDDVVARYRDAYTRHFRLWREHARRHGVALARIAAELDLGEVLAAEAVSEGAVEWCD